MPLALEPRPVGDPAGMHAFAGELAQRAEILAAQADGLQKRALAATFEGPAGSRFREFTRTQHRTLFAVSGDLKELANRIRSEAYAVQASIEAWERYRDAIMQQRIEAARGD